MGRDFTMSRRGFLGATAAAAAAGGAVALGGGWASPAGASTSPGTGRRIIPAGKLGTQQWNARDSFTRLDQAVLGRLDDDPLAPNVPLPGGFRSVFKYLASVGYTGIEYYSFNQGPNGPFTNAQLRAWQDEFGLVALGSHTGSPVTMYDPATNGFSAAGQAQVELAHTLGMDRIGFSGNPISSLALDDQTVNGTTSIGWGTLLDYANRTGELLKAEGLRYYWHPEEPSFQFFSDPAHPELSRTHLVLWMMANTDPSYLSFEMDTLHTWAGRLEYPDPVTGELMIDPLSWVLQDVSRWLGFHLKDGNRITPFVTPPGQPFTQTMQRTVDGITFTDAIADGEGDISKGYPSDPESKNPGFPQFLLDIQAHASASDQNVIKYISETDGGVGPATGAGADPGRSLRWERRSANYLLNMRAGAPSNR